MRRRLAPFPSRAPSQRPRLAPHLDLQTPPKKYRVALVPRVASIASCSAAFFLSSSSVSVMVEQTDADAIKSDSESELSDLFSDIDECLKSSPPGTVHRGAYE